MRIERMSKDWHERSAVRPGALTAPPSAVPLVYHWCMARTNIDIDDEACAVVMRRYHLATKREAVNFALRTVAVEALELDEARGLRGSGWEGDLDDLRTARVG